MTNENNDPYLKEQERQFQKKLDFLKRLYKVERDKDLAEKINVKPQAISGAKKRKRIPYKWIKDAREKFGKTKVDHGLYDFVQQDIFGPDPPMKKTDSVISTERMVYRRSKNDAGEIEQRIAEDLVSAAERNLGYKPKKSLRRVSEGLVRKTIVRDAIIEAEELLKEMRKAEDENGEE